MNLIESNFDNILDAGYELYSTTLLELKKEATSWYSGIDFEKFDNRWQGRNNFEAGAIEMKLSGLLCNLFFAYKNNGKLYLMDGFNRLFTNYGKVSDDTVVYIKIVTTQLQDHELMLAMYRLNMWKLYGSHMAYGGFQIKDFLDRGFRLFLHTKFGIDLYNRPESSPEYEKRLRNDSDIDVLDYYFRNESEMSDSFKTSYEGVRILMGGANIINDFKAIIDANNYLKAPFKNYIYFLRGFAMYLAYLRYTGITKQYTFDYFLELLYADKSFFKKLQGMSGTDSTRKNIYHFYRNLKLENGKD